MRPLVDRLPGLSVLVATVAFAAATGCAARQPARSFSELQQRVKPGNTVYVIDDAGTETKGKVVTVSASDLTLEVEGATRPMDAASVRQVQRYGDSLWNGLLIGSAIGTLGAIMTDRSYEPCNNDPARRCAQIEAPLMVVVTWAALGAGIDALIRGRHQVYLAPSQPSRSARRIVVAPQFGPSGAGVFVMVGLNKRVPAEAPRPEGLTGPPGRY